METVGMQLPVRLATSKFESFPRVAGKFKPQQWGAGIDISRQGKDLEAATQHLGMQKRLKGPFRFFVRDSFRER